MNQLCQLFISKIEDMGSGFSKSIFLYSSDILSFILCVCVDEKGFFCNAVKNYCPVTA
ncbi:hypothetical protein ECSTEC94C_1525 [Escherichia coli STEC_94C]|nr:hypothetical protein ECSTEC94C_1525 [Escherichia coli STEC_94C]EHW74404.1 hypothetical protein ECDEC10C_2574 [Escherichia coli DEC10C]EIJ13119.1 hypothetical protein EC900105_2418 [Escherichia coli 900105 (10e)]